MSKLLRQTFDIREGEGFRASMMFAYIFLIIAAIMIIKPVRNSIFISELGISQLPYVYVLVAIFAAFVALAYTKFTKRIRLDLLILYTFLIIISHLFIFWYLFKIDYRQSWFLYFFYIWVTIFAVITTSQFWLLANYVFNSREARRLFGFIGAGAISGGIFGGYLTSYLAKVIGSENLIFICIGFLMGSISILLSVWRISARQNYRERFQQYKRIRQEETTDNPFKLVIRSRHLVYLSGIIGIGVVVANLVDYQFSAIASEKIVNEDRLTSFFGFWLSNLSVASLVFQLFLTSKILKFFGVGASLFFLPFGILVGTAAVLFNPVLWSAVLLKVSDGSLKYSINKAGTELLFLPIPAVVKNKVKTFIDVFVDNLSKGIGGILLIVFTLVLGLSTQSISPLILGLIAVWIYLTIRVKQEYVNSFRLAIEKRTIDLEEQSVNLHDASILESLTKVLEGKNQRQILYVLGLIETVKNDQFLPCLQNLIHHPSNEIKAKVLEIIRLYDNVVFDTQARKLIGDESEEVRTEAIRYLCHRSTTPIETLKTLLYDQDYLVRGSALMCAAKEGFENREFQIEFQAYMKDFFEKIVRNFDSRIGEKSKEKIIKVNAAKVIGISNNPDLYPYLHILLKDQSLEVVQSAVTSAGQTKASEFVQDLISYLDNKYIRKYAREALSEFGEVVIDVLTNHLDNPNEKRDVRVSIPKVLALIGSQSSVNILITNLYQNDLRLRFEIIKALNKLKVRFPMLKFDERRIEEGIFAETKDYHRMITVLYTAGSYHSEKVGDSPNKSSNSIQKARNLLVRALEEKLDNNLERIFRLLGLKFQPDDIFNAYKGITSNMTDLRANAIEFLDNVLNSHFKKFIIPIVETSSINVMMDQVQELYGFGIPTETDCFKMLLEGNDNWLKVCSMYLIAEQKDLDCISNIERLQNNPDPIVKETADYSLEKLRN